VTNRLSYGTAHDKRNIKTKKGDSQYVMKGIVAAVKWQDTKTVTMLTTAFS
jgi:hypothetical protein